MSTSAEAELSHATITPACSNALIIRSLLYLFLLLFHRREVPLQCMINEVLICSYLLLQLRSGDEVGGRHRDCCVRRRTVAMQVNGGRTVCEYANWSTGNVTEFTVD